MYTRTQEKGAVNPQETDPDLPVGFKESLAEAWVGVGLYRVRGTECISACTGPLKEVFIIFIVFIITTIVFSQVK